MFTKITLILCILTVIAGSFFATGCDKHSGDDKRQDKSSNSVKQVQDKTDFLDPNIHILKQNEWMWISMWRKVAKEKGLEPSEVNEVSDILTDVLDFAVDKEENQSYSPEICTRYATSLRNFIDTQFLTNTSESRIGSGYLLAFSVVETACRLSRGKESSNDPTFEAFLDEICNDMIRPGFREVLSVEDYEHWSELIEQALIDFKANMGIVVRKLQDDLICPFLRKEEPVTAEVRENLVEWFEYPGHIPRYEEPTGILVSKDKLYKSKLKKFFVVDAMNECIYNLFYRQNKSQFKKNRYWGYMKRWSVSQGLIMTEAGLLRWPVHVKIRPNHRQNEIEKWERADGKANKK